MRPLRAMFPIFLTLPLCSPPAPLAASELDPAASTRYGWSELGLPRELAAGLGTAVATGDFNCDGHRDLAIGVPDHDSSTLVDVGQVIVQPGPIGTGVPAPGRQVLARSDSLSPFARFGYSLAAGDLDLDGCDDLVIGEPGHDDGRGAVHAFKGSPTGLNHGRGLLGQTPSSSFGHALAILPREAGLTPAVGIGEPGAPRSGVALVGRVWILNELLGLVTGSFHHCHDEPVRGLCGIALATGDLVHPAVLAGAPDVERIAVFHVFPDGTVERRSLDRPAGHGFMRFGRVFDVIELQANGPIGRAIALGQPDTAVNGRIAAGRVALIRLVPNLSTREYHLTTLWNRHQGDFGFTPETDDRFGSMVRRFDFDGDARQDLVIGAPGESFGSGPSTGGVLVLQATGEGELSTVQFLRPADLGVVERPALRFGELGTGVASLSNPAAGDDLVLGVPRAVRDPGFGFEGVVVRVPQASPVEIFADGFESGDTTAWSAAAP